MLRHSILSISLASLIHTASANLGLHGSDDLWSFFTRPDLRPPKYDVTIHNRDKLAPGYWFVNPYNFHHNFLGEDVKWMPCEAGPAIYDNDGELIWSGACIYGNHAVFEFNMVDYDDEEGVALVGAVQPYGHGFFLGQDYETKHQLNINDDTDLTNLHEFNVFDNGHRVLHTMRGPIEVSTESLGRKGTTWVENDGFRELDVQTEDVLFEWYLLDHISMNESTFVPEFHNRKGFESFSRQKTFDIFHINAVDKTPQGNYLISIRHTDSIIYIDGKTKEVLWRLGGKLNDFDMVDGWQFSRQHHIRWHESTAERMVVSFHNNNGADPKLDPQPTTDDASSGQLVELLFPKKKTGGKWTAKVLRQYDRPDGKISIKRGSMQMLPGGNVFMDWTMRGYMSEHTEDGEAVMEARFQQQRLGTYRAYKHTGWIGKPKERPVVRAFSYDSREAAATTACYVSWNGATEVATWEFYSNGEFVGATNRTGFETLYVAPRSLEQVTAHAFDRDGNELGKSKMTAVEVSQGWDPSSKKMTSLLTHTKDAVNGASFYVLLALFVGFGLRAAYKGFYARRIGAAGKTYFPWMNGYDAVPSQA